jgi:hypothetical protein
MGRLANHKVASIVDRVAENISPLQSYFMRRRLERFSDRDRE